MPEITQQYLRELLNYDPETGIVSWKSSRKKTIIGKRAGTSAKVGREREKLGRRQICINGKIYMEHRLIWLYMTGSWPEQVIDHIDGNGLNNKWNNLRTCSQSDNSCNSRIMKNNTSGIKGLHWDKANRKWLVYICRNGKNKNLGRYADKNQALAILHAHRQNLHGEFANHG